MSHSFDKLTSKAATLRFIEEVKEASVSHCLKRNLMRISGGGRAPSAHPLATPLTRATDLNNYHHTTGSSGEAGTLGTSHGQNIHIISYTSVKEFESHLKSYVFKKEQECTVSSNNKEHEKYQSSVLVKKKRGRPKKNKTRDQKKKQPSNMDRQSFLKKLLIDNKPTWTSFLRQKRKEEREKKKEKKQIQGEALQMNKQIQVIDLGQEMMRDNKGDLPTQTCEVFVEEAPKELFLCSESDEIQNTIEDEEISQESGPSNLLPIRQTRSSSTKTAGKYFDKGLDTLISKRREMKSKTNLIVGCAKCWGEYTAEYFPSHKCGEKKYPCRFCSAVLDSFSQNRKHVNTNHYFRDADDDGDKDRMGYRCVLCREWFLSTAYYKTHLIEGSACRPEPLVFCRHCDYKTLTADGLDSHCVQEHFDLGYEAKTP